MPSSVKVRADHAETSDDSRRYPQYCYWRNLIHSRQSDQNSRRYRRTRQSISRKKRDTAEGEEALKDSLMALTINTNPAALVKSQIALTFPSVFCEYIPAGPRRGELQAYAHIGQDWWSLQGGSNDAQFLMARRLTSHYNSPIDTCWFQRHCDSQKAEP